MSHPKIIQAGMGVAVSDWKLANTVARLGHMGVVSGTAIDSVFVRRLQNGDPGGHILRALQSFPRPELALKYYNKYFVQGGIPQGKTYLRAPMMLANPSVEHQELLMVSNFCEVFLAKEGHAGKIGINYLEKVQMPHLPSIYGALLAGVDYVLMGAGIPRDIPVVLDRLYKHEDAEYKLYVEGASPEDNFKLQFSPRKILGEINLDLKRPNFLAIISSNVLALTLTRKAPKPVDGFVIEHPTAGGHNAPPRGKYPFNPRGEPVYGSRDEVDLEGMKEIGLPFWLAGTRGSPEGLDSALQSGATGIQVGTAFALCEESGLDGQLKKTMLDQVIKGSLDVFTDPQASPTGFPFKVARMPGTNSEVDSYNGRIRVCDLGYLREAFKKEGGGLGYKCPSEPVADYVVKGGRLEDTVGRKCLCNGLMANIGLPQVQKTGDTERPLITIGDDVKTVGRFLSPGKSSYTAADVIRVLTGGQSLN